jgi:L-ascorbate metabolism protein UlaG (beta-lactamase superfamily)
MMICACNSKATTPDTEGVDVFKTPSGKEVVFHCIKHGSVRIVYDGKEIEIDPVTKIPPVTDYAALPKADYIFVTHEHGDHLDKVAIDALTKEGTNLITNKNCAEMLGKGTVMANGDALTLAPDIQVEAVPAYNNTPGRERFHPKGRDNGFIITLDGFRIYIAGDTEDIPEMSAIKDIDVAFMPCNQPYTMTPEQLNNASRTVQPKVLFPYHYSDTKIEQVVELLEGSGVDVRIRAYQ